MAKSKSKKYNHIKLADFHIGFAVICGLAISAALAIGLAQGAPINKTAAIVGMALFVGLHLALAWGCRRKLPIARTISQFAGLIMFMAFPIGTALSLLVYLPLTDWEMEPQAGQDNRRTSVHDKRSQIQGI